ncbi:hypothetical protein NDU88_006506 [Pleurodeles waltl]|uniref:Uncharacterized protein n=1 Tax=Pleurodeles waltl TaxID=8319 RepID=A0AAV7QI48_PLEWA|nr:hypothetical protein NDU88_006506 [Pleurodeles waltl]
MGSNRVDAWRGERLLLRRLERERPPGQRGAPQANRGRGGRELPDPKMAARQAPVNGSGAWIDRRGRGRC